MFEHAIDAFEELKKYVFIINRGNNNKSIFILFNDENFYHLLGLHKINLDMFFPDYIKTMSRKYKYMKKKKAQFNGIIENQIKEKDTLLLRIKTFVNIIDLLKSKQGISLFNLKIVPNNSLYNGDFGILKIYESIYCLLGLKTNTETNRTIICAPQSWMANTRVIQLTEFKRPLYFESITIIPRELYDEESNTICV